MSAWLFDFVILITLVTLIAIPISIAFDYDGVTAEIDKVEEEYKEEMIKDGLNPDITEEEYDALPEAEKDRYRDVDARRAKDERLVKGYAYITSVIVTLVFLSIFFAHLILNFIVPLFFKNGQTFGKKLFGIAVVHSNCVRMRNGAFFVRSIIGKCAIETMVPVFLLMMFLFGSLGILGIILLVLLFVLQIYSIASTRTNSAIHDLISDAAVVDLASQMIFETHDDLMAYKNKLHEELVNKAEY